MKRERDTQRGKLYGAEGAVFTSEEAAFHDKANKQLETVTECQQLVNRITNSQWWSKKFVPRWMIGGKFVGPRHVIKVTDGRGARKATARAGGRVINLPRWYRRRWIILHELTHCLTFRTDGHKVEAHGLEFAGELYRLGAAIHGSRGGA